jgi:hypothetical protein
MSMVDSHDDVDFRSPPPIRSYAFAENSGQDVIMQLLYRITIRENVELEEGEDGFVVLAKLFGVIPVKLIAFLFFDTK